MNAMFPRLFQRGRIGPLELRNRIVKAPTALFLAHADGSVSERQVRYYSEIARGGTGLVFVDNGTVLPEPHMGIIAGSDAFIPGLSLLASSIADYGARSALQLSHAGRDSAFVAAGTAKAASRVQWEGWYQWGLSVPQELTIEEIHELVGFFGDAARRGRQAGFDLVEVLGGHGTLPNNFLAPSSNMRTDMYGGSLYNRMRFLVEIVRDIRKKVGDSFPLSVRLSLIDHEPGGIELEESLQVAKALEAEGVSVIHVSGGTHAETMYCASPMLIPLAPHVPAAAALRKEVSIPLIVSGSIPTPELAEEVLASGDADFIAMARQFFADPEWPNKAREGTPEDIRPCIRCNDGCHDRSTLTSRHIVCTVNPTLFKHDTLAITPAERTKKVAVIGGGPGGMEAARVCALRGHNVSLYEKRKLGGALLEASVPEFKADIRRLLSYYDAQMEKLNINVINEEATIETIKAGEFDAVIVAAGAALNRLDVPGIDKPIVTDALAVLGGKAETGKRVVVVGGGVTGTEVGLFLAEQGKEVTFIEMLDEFMCGVGHNRTAYACKLGECGAAGNGVTVCTGTRLDSVLNDAAVVVGKDGKRQQLPADSIVLASGFLPQTALRDHLEEETSAEVYGVGDCLGPRMIFDAIHEGFLTARRI